MGAAVLGDRANAVASQDVQRHPSPASDGERVFAFFSSNDVICTDLDGTLLWYRGMTFDYPNASNSLGMSSSLVVADETLVVQVENDSESFTPAWTCVRASTAGSWTGPVSPTGPVPRWESWATAPSRW